MKTTKALKYTALAALVLGGAAGCATAPQEEPVEQQTQVEPAGPSRADAAAAVEAARASLMEAMAADALWRDTDELLAEAQNALARGEYDKAIQLANQAKQQSQNALAQKQREDARMREMAASAPATYMVERGDSLWAISGKSTIYGNPYQWPLIYKANRGQIRDADLIYPGQVFDIDRAASQSDVAAAIRHAKTRGAWSLGVVEESDRRYLMR